MNCIRIALVVFVLVCAAGHLAVAGDAKAPRPSTMPVVFLFVAKPLVQELAEKAPIVKQYERQLAAIGYRDDMSTKDALQWFDSHNDEQRKLLRDRGEVAQRCEKLAFRIWKASSQPGALKGIPRRDIWTHIDEIATGFQDLLESRPTGFAKDDIWQGIDQTIEMVNSDYAGPAICILEAWLDVATGGRAAPLDWESCHIVEPGRRDLYKRLIAWRATARATCHFDLFWRKIVGPEGIGHELVDLRIGNSSRIWSAYDEPATQPTEVPAEEHAR